MKILVTGFDKFGGASINPSELLLQTLPDKIGDIKLIKLVLPTVFYQSAKILKQAIDVHQPNIVICVGQAGGSSCISIERIAINIDDARIADNHHQQPIDKIIQSNGATAYFSTLPIKAILQKLQNCHIPAEISNSAGTFVCNHIMYQLLYLINTQYPQIKGGFIHIPYIPEQVDNHLQIPTMPLTQIVQSLVATIETCIMYYNCEDIQLIGGKEF